MKISIITVTKNNKAGLLRAIESVRSQTYKNVEHIIIDGGSTDGSAEAIYNLQFVSEADAGIYDAINKGIKLATGDVIGLLHSDDFFADANVLAHVADAFEKNEVDSVYGDLLYINKKGLNHRVWKSGHYNNDKILNGWMPPHPTLFIRKEIFDKYGLYRTDMKIASDYEMILRLFYKFQITTHYLPITTYCMTIGGASNRSLRNIIIKSSEDYKAIKIHGLPYPIKTLMLKNLSKIPQFFSR